ncbi:MAG: DUF3500 domain-containing protein [Chloroflexota bacterium]
MPTPISRRTFLRGSLATGSLLVLPGVLAPRAQTITAAAQAPATTAELIAANTLAAGNLLDALDGTERDAVTFDMDDALSRDWNWTLRQTRPGLQLTPLTEAKRDTALALVATGMSETGFLKALDIMALQRDMGNDPLRFWVRIFGEPGSARWGWSFLGHHLTVNTRIIGDEIFTTPMFLGARPTVTQKDGDDYHVMSVEELTARELVLSLGDDAIYTFTSPGDILGDDSYLMEPLAPQGIATARFNTAQLEMLDSIVEEYITAHPAPVADAMREQVAAEGIENLTFGWTGSTVPEERHTYAVFGETFLLTYNNVRHSGTHIHSVWRNYGHDFGASRL